MLPAETLADVVYCLGSFDLVGLKMANKLFSALANQRAQAIRFSNFSDFEFYIFGSRIHVWLLESGARRHQVCRLTLTSENNLADFISEAFRNCIIDRLTVERPPNHVLNAIGAVANSTIVGYFHVTFGLSENMGVQELFDFVDNFCGVKV